MSSRSDPLSISRPFLGIKFARQPPWGSVKNATILRWTDLEAQAFVKDAGLTDIVLLRFARVTVIPSPHSVSKSGGNPCVTRVGQEGNEMLK